MSVGADRTYFFDGGPRHGQRVEAWEAIAWFQIYRSAHRSFDFGAGDEQDPPIDIGWYRVMGNCLLWEGWESETVNEEVQEHGPE